MVSTPLAPCKTAKLRQRCGGGKLLLCVSLRAVVTLTANEWIEYIYLSLHARFVLPGNLITTLTSRLHSSACLMTHNHSTRTIRTIYSFVKAYKKKVCRRTYKFCLFLSKTLNMKHTNKQQCM